MPDSIRRRPFARFTFAALLVITLCALIVRVQAHSANADVAAWGATFDLTITIPLLYWFFVVRTGKARAITIAPLFVVCTMVAAAILPRGEQQFLRELARVGGALTEVLIAVRVVRWIRGGQTDWVTETVGAELKMFYYALFCWKKKPADEPAITFHERNGWSTILVCILVMLTAESIGMHLLIALWKPKAAWLWTAFDVWAAIWLIGDYHALRLRRTTIDDDALHLRFGMRWNASIPLTNVAAVDDVHDESEWKRKGVLKIAILDEPRWLIRFTEPVVVRGLAGIRKTVDAIAILPDDDEAVSVLRTAHAAAVARAARP